MKPSWFLLMLACILFPVAPVSAEDAPASRDDAVKMVKDAVAELASEGHFKTMNDISDPKSKYHKGDLYLVAENIDGKCVANGINPSLIGKSGMTVKDVDGKAYIAERVALAKDQTSFWQEYKNVNPITHAVSAKQSYCETADDLIICGGVYK